MIISSQNDLKRLRRIGTIVANCLHYMLSQVEAGMSTLELDQIGADFLSQAGARSAPMVMYQFPGHTCISLNQEAAHGIPSASRIIQRGDLINIDVSAVLDGYYGDTGGTMVIPPVSPELKNLCKAGKRALDRAIGHARAGECLNIIGKSIQKEATKSGYTIIKNLCSHGIGRKLHEAPDHIPGFYNPKEKRVLAENMVITIEPFLSTGTEHVIDGHDGWTLLNDPGCFSAQYEHTMVIRKGHPVILTEPDQNY